MPTCKSYLTGFIVSIVLTLAAYFATVNHILGGGPLTAALIGLALAQLIVQLIFFLHLWEESNPRWNLAVFLSTISIIFIIVVGSLWIMHNLNYNMMSPADTDRYMLNQEGMQK